MVWERRMEYHNSGARIVLKHFPVGQQDWRPYLYDNPCTLRLHTKIYYSTYFIPDKTFCCQVFFKTMMDKTSITT